MKAELETCQTPLMHQAPADDPRSGEEGNGGNTGNLLLTKATRFRDLGSKCPRDSGTSSQELQ